MAVADGPNDIELLTNAAVRVVPKIAHAERPRARHRRSSRQPRTPAGPRSRPCSTDRVRGAARSLLAMERLPVIDVSPLVAGDDHIGDVAAEIDRACREFGFFYVEGHGVDEDLLDRLDDAARAFFALPEADKAEIAMARGGRAWRGWFPFEGELTSGRPDRKEGIYFGEELPADDPRVVRGTPLHGAEPVPRAGARAPRRRCSRSSTR